MPQLEKARLDVRAKARQLARAVLEAHAGVDAVDLGLFDQPPDPESMRRVLAERIALLAHCVRELPSDDPLRVSAESVAREHARWIMAAPRTEERRSAGVELVLALLYLHDASRAFEDSC